MAPQHSSDTPPPPQTKGFRYRCLADTIIPTVGHVTKANLLKDVNDCIQDLLNPLAPDYELVRANPSLLDAKHSLGDTNYMDAGHYFQVVSTLQISSSVQEVTYAPPPQNTVKKGPSQIKWLMRHLPEAIIMDNEELGWLLLMREELKQTEVMKDSPRKPHYGLIRCSPHYMQLYQHFYPEQSDHSAVAHPPTPLATSSQSHVTSWGVLKDINPSCAPSHAPLGDSTDFDWMPPPYILPSSSHKPHKSWVSISDDSDIERNSEVKYIKPCYGPPVLFIFWVQVIGHLPPISFHSN